MYLDFFKTENCDFCYFRILKNKIMNALELNTLFYFISSANSNS